MTEIGVPNTDNVKQSGTSHRQGLVQEVVDLPWRWIIAVIMLVSVITGFFDRISVAVLFTDHAFNAAMGTDFDPAKLGMLMTAFLLAYAISALFLSFVGDLIGPHRALGWASGVWGVLMFLMGSSSSYAGIITCRALLGLSEGPQFSLISKIVQNWFPRHELTRANALWMVGSPIGSAIGFPLTLWLVTSYGWRSSFYVLGALNLLVVMPLILTFVRSRPGVGNAQNARSDSHGGLRLADIGVVLGDPKVWMLAAFGAGLLTYLWGLNSWLPTYLQRVRHFDLHKMGFYSALPFILMFLAEMTSGYIADKCRRYALMSSLGLLLAGILLFIATQVEQPQLAAVIIAFSAAAWGFGLPTHYALALHVLPEAQTATGIGFINGMGNLIGACAPAIIGFVVAATGNYGTGLLFVVVASVFGASALLPLLRFKPAA